MKALIFSLILFVSLPLFAAEFVVKVGVYQNYPLMFKKDNGDIGGLGYDILEAVAKENDWKLVYVYDKWASVLKQLKDGDIDVMFPIAFTIKRTESMFYNSETVLTNWGQIFSRSGSKGSSILELDGKTVSVLRDDVYFSSKNGIVKLAESFGIQPDYKVFDNYDEVLKSVENSESDFGLVSRFFGLANSDKYNLEKTSILIHPVDVRFAMPLGAEKTILISDLIDKYISKSKHLEGSAYYKSYQKWIASANDTGYWSGLRVFITVLIIPVLLILVIIVILRAEVRRKTREITQKNIELEKEIDERRKIENELNESQDKYSTLFNTSYNPVAIISEDGYLVDVNGELVSYFGYKKDKLMTMSLDMLVIKEHIPRVKEIMEKMYKTKKWSFELDFVKSWGDVFNAEISASRLEVSKKTFIQLVIMDITSRKKASELLNRRQEYLEKKVDEEVQKRRQNERLMMQQSKMAAMGQMMSAIAHQWRQPLNSIAIYVQDFEDAYKYNELTKDYVSDIVEQSMKQINFMSKTIDDFKNFFKPDKDEVAFEVCSETMSAVSLLGVQLVRNNIELVMECHGVEIDISQSEFECDKSLCSYVKGFPNEFKQVLLNLVQNARDAVVESGITGGRILVSVSESNGFVKISVSDNGSGIPKDVAERIFEPYYTTKEEGQGTGVGLYMSKIIIEQNMRGRLYFENNDPGAKFVIDLRKDPNASAKESKESDLNSTEEKTEDEA